MKKNILVVIILIIGVSYLIYSNLGIRFGEVRVGKQVDLHQKQNTNFEESVFFKKHYSKDSLIVLNLWATWCKPCIKEIPYLNKIKDEFSSRPVTFLSLSTDKDSIKLATFIKNDEFDFNDITFENLEFRKTIINTLDKADGRNFLGFQTLPKTYIIKNGKVVKVFKGTIEKNLDKEIELYVESNGVQR